MEDFHSEQDRSMALVANIRSDSLPGSLCANTHSRRGAQSNAHGYLDAQSNAHRHLDVQPNAHRYANVYLTATFTDSHGDAHTADPPQSRHAYACPPRLV